MKTNFDYVVQNVVSDENNKYEQNYLKLCKKYWLKPEWLHAYFKMPNHTEDVFQLLGLVKKGSTQFVVIKLLNYDKPSYISLITLGNATFIGDEPLC